MYDTRVNEDCEIEQGSINSAILREINAEIDMLWKDLREVIVHKPIAENTEKIAKDSMLVTELSKTLKRLKDLRDSIQL